MIFIIGGAVILVISFVIALISLIREQKNQETSEEISSESAVAKNVEERTAENIIAENANEKVENVRLSDEEVKTANREEAYKILQNRVLKLSEADAENDKAVSRDIGLNDKNQNIHDDVLVDEPETNIENPLEADMAASEKVPFPWEDKTSEENSNVAMFNNPTKIPDQSNNLQNQNKVLTPDENSSLSGQINIGDLKKNDE